MCLGVPMRIIEIVEPGKMALADAQGVKREISTIFLNKEVKKGDWVTVHVGYALDIIDMETAEEIFYVMGLRSEPPVRGGSSKGDLR
jgi:hydrogenase assembly chaperone HypC/HupF